MAEESIIKDEVVAKIAKEDGCLVDDAGPIKMIPRDIRVIWIKCSLAANKLVDNGRLRIGWSNAKVNLLPNRRLQCFKCLKIVYTKKDVDRNDLCYNCRKKGHKAQGCSNRNKCILYEKTGWPSSLRIDREKCNAPISRVVILGKEGKLLKLKGRAV